MNENEELQSGFPNWLTEDYKLMEPEFCQTFLREYPMRCIRGRFYTVDGLVADESVLKKEIYDQISPWLEIKIARKVDELLNALRMAAYSEPIALECDRIHVANGTLFVDGRFTLEKTCQVSVRVPHFASPALGVRMDGREVGLIAFAPHTLCLGSCGAGVHRLEICAYGNRFNTFGTLHNCNDEYQWYGPDSYRTRGCEWSESWGLRPFGILSRVEILEG